MCTRGLSYEARKVRLICTRAIPLACSRLAASQGGGYCSVQDKITVRSLHSALRGLKQDLQMKCNDQQALVAQLWWAQVIVI